ncbi:MAG: hypothetical protein HKL99_06380 [Burkholderiales bacterium]|nr:hypothetical protein [Burkholderiales bacterium]
MAVELTYFGFVFIPIAIFVGFRNNVDLIYLLIFSSIFQAASVLNVNSQFRFGLQPYYLVSILLTASMCVQIIINKGKIVIESKKKNLAIIILLFGVYSAISSFILPVVYNGMNVYSPRLGIDAQAEFGGVALSWSYSNLAQAIYILLNVFNVVFVLINIEKLKFQRANHFLIFSAFVVSIVGLYQFFANYFGLYFPSHFFYSNPTYYIGDNQKIANYLRINSTFSEPSVAGIFLASVTLYFFASSISKKKFSKLYFITAMIMGFSAAITTSTTAYFVLFIGFILFAFFELISAIIKRRISKVVVLISFLTLAIAVVAFSIITYYGIFPEFYDMTIDKTQSLSYINRQLSNVAAFKITLESWLLGVGLGSNRPSSFIAYLFSNIGVIGSFIFFVFLCKLVQFSLIYRDKSLRVNYAPELFFLCVLLGMAASVPDLSFGILWIAIILVLLWGASGMRLRAVGVVATLDNK